MRSLFRFTLSALVLSQILCGNVLSQPQSDESQNGDLIILTVTVTTNGGRHAKGLGREAFQIKDGKETRLVEFLDGGDTPTSLAILVDTSGSMQFFESAAFARPEPIGTALAEFFQMGHDENEYLVVAFDKTARFLTDWKDGKSLLSQKLNIGQQKKHTAFYDACVEVIARLKTSKHSKKALLVISDGQDNVSKHSFNDVRELLKRSDIPFYAIGVLPQGVGSALGVEGEIILREFSDLSGGQALFPNNKKEMSMAMNLLATQLRHQYRVGFRVKTSQPQKKWHRIKVSVVAPQNAPQEFTKLNVRTRQGYYAN